MYEIAKWYPFIKQKHEQAGYVNQNHLLKSSDQHITFKEDKTKAEDWRLNLTQVKNRFLPMVSSNVKITISQPKSSSREECCLNFSKKLFAISLY